MYVTHCGAVDAETEVIHTTLHTTRSATSSFEPGRERGRRGGRNSQAGDSEARDLFGPRKRSGVSALSRSPDEFRFHVMTLQPNCPLRGERKRNPSTNSLGYDRARGVPQSVLPRRTCASGPALPGPDSMTSSRRTSSSGGDVTLR